MADKNLKPMNLSSSERFAVLWTKAQPTVSAFVSSLVPNFHQSGRRARSSCGNPDAEI